MLFAITNTNYCQYIKNKRKTCQALAGRNTLSEGDWVKGRTDGPRGSHVVEGLGTPRGVADDKKGIT